MKYLFYLLILLCPLSSTCQEFKQEGSNFINSLLIEKDYQKSYSAFGESIKKMISINDLKDVSEQLIAQIGKFKDIIEVNNDNETYYFYSEFENDKLDIQLTFDKGGKITGLFFVPHKIFDKNDENTLNIKSDKIELKGTFLNPNDDSQKTIVIFIHGSGPNDRNSTIGENQPFKDIAEYLFAHGIASYRYDKRTYSYPASFDDNSTVQEEVIEDVINIVDFFKSKYIDYKIVLLGHSLGGYLLPKIIENQPGIYKAVFLSANARPLDEIVVEQYEYINKIDPSIISTSNIVEVKRQVNVLNSNSFSLSTPKSDLPMNLSPHYWKFLLNYNPLELVKKINLPMFFAQGGKDYQVTEKDFNLWKEVLKDNKKVIFKYYPSLTHIFIEGGTIPSPKDYEQKRDIFMPLLEDIVHFIK